MTKEQFKKFAKEEFGYDISFEKSDEPDTYESLFGSCKGCEHAPTTYEEYCLHTCCPDAYTDKAAGCELFWTPKQTEKSCTIHSIIEELEQEPYEDAVSRNAITKTLNEMDRYIADELILCGSDNKFPKNEVFIVDDVYEQIVEQLSSVTDKMCFTKDIQLKPLPKERREWIPVSERLPEEFESVLVCYKSQGGMAQCVTERLVNIDGSNRWSAMYGQEPIAWMPLPEPYKVESEDKKKK